MRARFVIAPLALAALALTGCASIPSGRAAVDSVAIDGSNGVAESDVEDKLATTASPRFLGLFAGVVFDYEIYDRLVFQRDLERVERFYRARGYYEAHARAGRVTYESPNHVAVTIAVEEGAPVLTTFVALDGIDGLPERVGRAVRVASETRLPLGVPFDEEDYDGAQAAIGRALTDRGYAYAEVKRHARVDLVRHAAYVTFAIKPGIPARMGAIAVVGLGDLPEAPVRRALDLETGEPYSTQALSNAERALLDLGVFGSVTIEPDLRDPAATMVPISVRVDPTPLRSMRLGGGFELDVIKTDVHLEAGWSSRNFLGGLRRFSFDVRPGVVIYPTRVPNFQTPTDVLPEVRSTTELHQPGFIEARTNGLARADGNIYPVILTPDVSTSAPVVGYREGRVSVGADRALWRFWMSLTYNAQLDLPFTYLGPLDPALRSVLVSYVDLHTHVDLRDDKVHPRRGVYIGNEVQAAGGIFGGDAEDLRIQPEVRAYLPLSRRVTLATRGSIGFLFPLNYGDTLRTDTAAGQVPPGVDRASWERDVQIVYFRSFFAGGPISDRGWPLRGIGPHGIVPFYSPQLAEQQLALQCAPGSPTYDPVRCAVPLGGLSLWEASVELRFSAARAFELATFCDTADVSQGRVDLRFERPHLSCGLGVRYDTPVGPIRLDVAYRIPGLQSLVPVLPGDDANPGTILGQPIAFALGIGEAF